MFVFCGCILSPDLVATQQTSTSSGKKPHHTFKSSVNESAINSAFKQCVDGEGSIASKSTNNTKGGKVKECSMLSIPVVPDAVLFSR